MHKTDRNRQYRFDKFRDAGKLRDSVLIRASEFPEASCDDPEDFGLSIRYRYNCDKQRYFSFF